MLWARQQPRRRLKPSSIVTWQQVCTLDVLFITIGLLLLTCFVGYTLHRQYTACTRVHNGGTAAVRQAPSTSMDSWPKLSGRTQQRAVLQASVASYADVPIDLVRLIGLYAKPVNMTCGHKQVDSDADVISKRPHYSTAEPEPSVQVQQMVQLLSQHDALHDSTVGGSNWDVHDVLSTSTLMAWLQSLKQLLSMTDKSAAASPLSHLPELGQQHALGDALAFMVAASEKCSILTPAHAGQNNHSNVSNATSTNDHKQKQQQLKQQLEAQAALSEALQRVRQVLYERNTSTTAFPVTRRAVVAVLLVCSHAQPGLLVATGTAAPTGSPPPVKTHSMRWAFPWIAQSAGSAAKTDCRWWSWHCSNSRGQQGIAPAMSAHSLQTALEAVANDSLALLRWRAWSLLALLYEQQRLARQAKQLIEYLHISKTGGTSMCSVAGLNDCHNPNLNMHLNCQVGTLTADIPIWTRTDLLPAGPLTAALGNSGFSMNCARRRQTPIRELSCRNRRKHLQYNGFTFVANENSVHGGEDPALPGITCPEMVNVITLRPPLQHLPSLLNEIIITHQRLLDDAPKHGRTAVLLQNVPPLKLPRDLEFWRRFAPSALDNYFVRMLTGKHAHCLPYGGVSAVHLQQAQLNLLAMDVVLLLGQDDSSDVLFHHALNWAASLRKRSLRQAASQMNNHSTVAATPHQQLQLSLHALGFDASFVTAVVPYRQLDIRLFAFASVAHHLDVLFQSAAAQLARLIPTATAAPRAEASQPRPWRAHSQLLQRLWRRQPRATMDRVHIVDGTTSMAGRATVSLLRRKAATQQDVMLQQPKFQWSAPGSLFSEDVLAKGVLNADAAASSQEDILAGAEYDLGTKALLDADKANAQAQRLLGATEAVIKLRAEQAAALQRRRHGEGSADDIEHDDAFCGFLLP